MEIEDRVIYCNTVDEFNCFLDGDVELPKGLTRNYITKELKSFEHDIKEVAFTLREYQLLIDDQIELFHKHIIDIFVSTYSGDDRYYCRKDMMI
ncbi:MAG: hypothetical protein E6356_13840 [Terrisporobacter othiniensis]|nr:hypothetical protein [Terrisporobacter othiniensis]